MARPAPAVNVATTTPARAEPTSFAPCIEDIISPLPACRSSLPSVSGKMDMEAGRNAPAKAPSGTAIAQSCQTVGCPPGPAPPGDQPAGDARYQQSA